MIKKIVISLLTVVLGTGLLMAHGDPLLGTVTAIDKDVLTINGKDNKEVKIMLDAKTKYMMGTKAAKMADVKVGEKVSIDAMMDAKMKMYVAESVTVPVAKVATAAKPVAKPAETVKKSTTAASETSKKSPVSK